jgi:hypothetical protein
MRNQVHEPERSRIYGLLICAVSVLLGAAFIIGVLRRSYAALALPVVAGSIGALYIAFWIGRALVTTPIAPAEERSELNS